MLDPNLTHRSFEAFSLIAAPALLTNATCVLAMSTINRMLRTRDRMHELFLETRKNPESPSDHTLSQTNRVERQAVLLLQALGTIYVALGCFAGATLMTLVGGGLTSMLSEDLQQIVVIAGVSLVFIGVTALVFGSVRLFQATQSSLTSLRAEAKLIRSRRPIS
jgi:hypothetical protein